MDPNTLRTASELAADAEQISGDAKQAAQGYVSESRRIINDAAASIRPKAQEFKDLASEAADTAAGLARDAGDLSRSATRTAKVYASQGAQVARDRMVRMAGTTRQYVADNPLLATLAAVATGAAIMVLMRHSLKGPSHNRT